MNFRNFLFLFILVVLSACASPDPSKIPPTAEKGTLDLRDWDFAKDGSVTLKGEWEFYWEEILKPQTFLDNTALPKPRYFILPGLWNGHEIKGKSLEGEGYATFHLKVLLSEPTEGLAVYSNVIQTAFELYVDGSKLGGSGVVGISRETTVPKQIYKIMDISSTGSEIDIVLHISNFHHAKGGPRRAFTLGLGTVLRDQRETNIFSDLFFSGCFLIFGLYHIALFLTQRNEKSSLYFGSFCLVFSLRTLITGEYYLTARFPDQPFELYIFLNYLTVFLVPLFCAVFIRTLFPNDYSKWVTRSFTVVVAIFSLITLTTPVRISSYLIGSFRIILLLLIVYTIYSLCLTLVRKRDGAWILFGGFLVLAATAINDILFASDVINSRYLGRVGLLAFIFSQGILLSIRFSKAFSNVTYLLSELSDKSSELKKKNKQLLELDKLKDQFLSNTSHELRTPLMGIVGMSESMLENEKEDISEQQKKQLQIINHSGRRLSHLIDDILDFSKLKQDELAVSLEPVNLTQITEDVIAHFSPSIEEKSCILVNGLPENLPLIKADKNRFQQVLFNLIGNAVKYTDKGEIIITAKLLQDNIEITINDTGIGIPEDQLDEIFQPFKQARNADDRRFRGTGLGLSLTRKLIELQGGKIKVQSKLGKGTTFVMTFSTFSCKDITESVNSISPINETISSDRLISEPQFSLEGRNEHILIVDDDFVVQQVILQHLTDSDYKVSTAINGIEALEILDSNHDIDLVLLDVKMPDLDGYETCRRIRKLFTSKELPVLFLTAKSQVKDIVKGLARGGNDYIIKPTHKSELLARIKTHLEAKQSYERLESNISLRAEIKRRKKVEEALKGAKRRMIRLLDAADEGIISTDQQGRINFFNRKSEKIFNRHFDQVLNSPVEELIPELADFDSSTAALNQKGNGSFKSSTLIIKTEQNKEIEYHLNIHYLNSDQGMVLTILQKFNGKLEHLSKTNRNKNENTNSMVSSSKEKPYPEIMKQLTNEYDSLLLKETRNLPAHLDQVLSLDGLADTGSFRSKLAEILKLSVLYWSRTTYKSKIDLAEASGIWTVSLDSNGTQRTRTLDRYLSIDTIPKRPNWRSVIQTAYFVVDECPHSAPELLSSLSKILKETEKVLMNQDAL